MRSLKIGLGLLVLTGAAGGASLAQDVPKRPPAAAAAGPQDGPHRFHPFADSHEARFDGPREGGRLEGGHRGGPGRMGGFRGDPGQHIEGRIAFLKAELKITEAQTRQWEQYATFMRDAAKTRADAQAAGKAAMPQDRPGPGEARQPRERTPLLERLDRHEKRLQTMLQLAQKRKAATESLFKVLNDEQKKLAEDLIRG